MYEAKRNKEKVSRIIDDGNNVRQMTKNVNILQRLVLDKRTGTDGYRDAKKIKCNNGNVGWWQFFVDSRNHVRYEFTKNEIDQKKYIGKEIPQVGHGINPVLSFVNMESSEGCLDSGIPLNRASDGTVFQAADEKSDIKRDGTTLWHHGANPYELYLLDKAIHEAFVPHRGWASTVGSRNKNKDKDFVVEDEETIPKKRKKGWSTQEVNYLREALNFYGLDNWKIISDYVGRTKNECQLMWNHVLNPNISSQKFTKEEDEKLMSLVIKYNGKRWSEIAAEMGTRTDVQCRFHYKRFVLKSQQMRQPPFPPAVPAVSADYGFVPETIMFE